MLNNGCKAIKLCLHLRLPFLIMEQNKNKNIIFLQ